MARKSDVNITLSGFPGVTPIGLQVTYGVGMIPTASLDLAPAAPGVIKIKDAASFGSLESFKRTPISVQASVTTHSGAGSSTRSLNFDGLFDGLTMSNLVGGNSYMAVLKNKAQVLLELTTTTPGLVPGSTNVHRVAEAGLERSNGSDEIQKFYAANLNFKQSPIRIYTDLLKWIINTQLSGKYVTYAGTDNKMSNGKDPFEEVFKDERYKKSLAVAQGIFNSIDLSGVSGGLADTAAGETSYMINFLEDAFTTGPTVLLENYINFLHSMGCSLIFSNSKIFVVPVNSVLKQEKYTPSFRQMQKKPNHAGPADYNNYSYSDIGYRDISCVMVMPRSPSGGSNLGKVARERGIIGVFRAPQEISKSGGVLLVEDSIWSYICPSAPAYAQTKDVREQMNQGKQPVYAKASSGVQSKKKAIASAASVVNEKLNVYDQIKNLPENYAEIRLYQERYKDRQGTLILDFNPSWVPGTGGTIYIRETKTTLAFYVNQVTHNIVMGAPNSGSALTTVNFSCSRIGTNPPGVSKYVYLGYDPGKEKQIQQKFVEDITSSSQGGAGKGSGKSTASVNSATGSSLNVQLSGALGGAPGGGLNVTLNGALGGAPGGGLNVSLRGPLGGG